MSEKVDVIVVGAGMAGLGAAYHLAEAGLEVLVVERGDYPGSKNVSGGRLYLNPVRPFFPDLFAETGLEQIPFERRVVKERLTMMSAGDSATLDYRFSSADHEPWHSATLLRSGFDRWLADQVSERGAMVVPGYKVDDLALEGDRVAGIVSAGDEVLADVVLAADGALSFIAEKAGLRERYNPKHFALGIKEVIELPAATIEDRFGLLPGEGAAQLFFGDITLGMVGGGFAYTNRESLSLGLVVAMHAMEEKGAAFEASELMDAFKARPELAALVRGGNLVEYSAHAIPEQSLASMRSLVCDGLIVAGDAAGLALNMGITVRGMDFALASGAMAAQAILAAKQEGDFSAKSLGRYEAALKNSFVLQDHNTFGELQDFLENPRLYDDYPQAVTGFLKKLFWIGEQPKEKLFRTVMQALRGVSLGTAMRDLWKGRRI